MFVFSLIFLVVALLLIGIGVAIGIGLLLATGAAVTAGIVSTSVVCGVLRRRVTTGMRVFFYQASLVAGVCAGVTVSWLVSAVWNLQLSPEGIVLIGALSGASVGLVFGVAHSWLLECAAQGVQRWLGEGGRDGKAEKLKS